MLMSIESVFEYPCIVVLCGCELADMFAVLAWGLNVSYVRNVCCDVIHSLAVS